MLDERLMPLPFRHAMLVGLFALVYPAPVWFRGLGVAVSVTVGATAAL